MTVSMARFPGHRQAAVEWLILLWHHLWSKCNNWKHIRDCQLTKDTEPDDVRTTGRHEHKTSSTQQRYDVHLQPDIQHRENTQCGKTHILKLPTGNFSFSSNLHITQYGLHYIHSKTEISLMIDTKQKTGEKEVRRKTNWLKKSDKTVQDSTSMSVQCWPVWQQMNVEWSSKLHY